MPRVDHLPVSNIKISGSFLNPGKRFLDRIYRMKMDQESENAEKKQIRHFGMGKISKKMIP